MKNTRDFMYMLALVLSLLTFNANAMEHLCDKWNVLMDSRFELGPINGEVWTEGYQLQGDTTINNMKYSCLMFADVRKNQQSKSWEIGRAHV